MSYRALGVLLALALVSCSGDEDDDNNDDNDDGYRAATGGVPNTTDGAGAETQDGEPPQDGQDGQDGEVVDPGPPLVCKSAQVNDSGVEERVKAAYCFGLFYNDKFSCTNRPAQNQSMCTGEGTGFQFVASWGAGDRADIRDSAQNLLLGSVTIVQPGQYTLTRVDGPPGECTFSGGTAELCSESLE